MQHLRARSAPHVFAFHVPNGGYRKPIEGAILKSLGVVAGTPDIFIVKGGHCFALELKAEKGRISDNQREAMRRLEAAGATVGVAHGLDAALSTLEQWGVLAGRVQG